MSGCAARRFHALLKGVATRLGRGRSSPRHADVRLGAVRYPGAGRWLLTATTDARRRCRKPRKHARSACVGGVLGRAVVFAVVAIAGVAIVLWPYWIALAEESDQPDADSARLARQLHSESDERNQFLDHPHGRADPGHSLHRDARIGRAPAAPVAVWLVFHYAARIGGTTPAGKILLGRAFQVLTFERFTFWATLMAMPFVGMLAVELDSALSHESDGGLAIAAVVTMATVGGVDHDSSHQQFAFQC